jgi:two-component system LytT family response regulator
VTATFRVLVIDDEEPARAKVRRLLKDDARFELVGEAIDGVEALAQIAALDPDVIVLDVQMPGMNGFEVLAALGDAADFAVVFSTAFDAHALRAFEAHAVDYLLKPYDAARFRRAMDKAVVQRLGSSPGRRELLAEMVGTEAGKLVLRTTDGAWVTVESRHVVRLRAANKHTRVMLAERTEPRVRRPLRELETQLDGDFVRIHRTEIANVRAVRRIEPLSHGDALLVFADDSTSVLTRTYRAAFLSRWQGEGRGG